MALPIRASLEDIAQTCGYLASKPTGATLKDITSVVGEKLANPRRIAALQAWGLIELQEDGRYKVTDDGRRSVRGEGDRATTLQKVIRRIPAYLAMIERAAHRREDSLSVNDVAAHWHSHFKEDARDSEENLKAQVISFFQIAEGADLGTMILGRRGAQTRFSFSAEALKAFTTQTVTPDVTLPPQSANEAVDERRNGDLAPPGNIDQSESDAIEALGKRPLGQGIFIAHGKNKKPLEQLKRVLDQFRIVYKVAVDEPNLGRPIGAKIRETMEACNCAILIFTADEEFKDLKGETVWRPSENVVYELGASGYLYDNRLVILKESQVSFPSNFRDIGYISFEKDQLEAKAMDILKELIGFGIVKVST